MALGKVRLQAFTLPCRARLVSLSKVVQWLILTTTSNRAYKVPTTVVLMYRNRNSWLTKRYRRTYKRYLARIDSCKSTEELAGAGTVCITPLTSQTDTEGTALDMVSIPEIPHTRYQYGIAAVVIDPVPGDIVAVNVCKNDISTIKQGTKEPVNAGSFRQFSQSDSIAGSSVHTQTPEIYTVYRQDKTMKTRAPEGIRVETDKTLDEYAGENRLIEIGQNRSETIGANSDITIQGNATLVVNGDNSISINGSQSQNIGGSVSITIGGTLTIKAPSITFDTPQAKFTGNVT